MHACLSVDEILRLLAYELVASEAKATAVALACCRKSFEDPALDVLWETQDRLPPLLKSLPRDVWNGDGYTVTVSAPTTRVLFLLNYLNRKSFKRFPTAPEWARFRKYARRMRRLRGPGDPNFLSSEVLAVLQFRAINEPLFPNLKSLDVWSTTEEFVPFIPSFLSPRTTSISITLDGYNLPKAIFASMVTAFPVLCPNLQTICLYFLPRDPIITAAVSEFLLTANRDALRHLRVDSPLTEEAREVVHKLSDLCGLWVVVEGSNSLPTMVLPNLTEIDVEYDHNFNWLQGFRGATLGRLNSVTFRAKSESTQVAGFLEAFESVGIATLTTLSTFRFFTPRPWRPNYRSLLSFKQLRGLEIEFPCEGGCSSTIDDDILTDLARAMPKLEDLLLGGEPCRTPTGVTTKGLTALAHHCPNLSSLRIHLLVDSFSAPATPYTGSTAPQKDCALAGLCVGETPISEESVLMVALTLVRIFPRIMWINYADENWGKVSDAIRLSGQVVASSSKKHSLATPRSNIYDASPGATLEGGS
jgi:hypothetical protein